MKKIYSWHKVILVCLLLSWPFRNTILAQTFANTQVNGTGGLCLLCGVSNPNNAVDSSLTTYSSFNITAGLAGVTVWQTLIFPSVSNTCDSLIIGIGSGNAVLSANLFGGVTVQTYNGSTDNNDARTVDSSVVRLLQNNTLAQIVLHPTSTFDRVKLTLSSSLLGLLNGFYVYYAYDNQGKPADPVYTVPEDITCGGVVIPITNYQPGIQYKVGLKYTAAPNVIFDSTFTLINIASINIPNYIYDVIYQADIYVQAINPFTGCVSDTVHQSFIRGGSGQLPVVPEDSVTICLGNSATLYAYTPISTLFAVKWYNAPVGGELLHTGNYYTVNPDSTTTYYVTSASACEFPSRMPVTVIVNKLPAPSYNVPEGFVCGSQSLLLSNYNASYNYRTRLVYTSLGTLELDTSYIVRSNVIVTPDLVSYAPAQVTVYVQAYDSLTNCASDTVTMGFVLGGSGAYPSVNQDTFSICQGDSATLYAYIPISSIPVIRWYNSATGGNLLDTGNYYKVSPSVTTTYYVTSAQQCEYPVRRPVTVIVNACMLSDAKIIQSHDAILNDAASALKIFPNPSPGLVYISSQEDLAGAQVIVSNMLGQLIKRDVLESNSFVFEGVNGMYVVTVITRQGKAIRGKVLLQR